MERTFPFGIAPSITPRVPIAHQSPACTTVRHLTVTMELVQFWDNVALCLWQVEQDMLFVYAEHVIPSNTIITLTEWSRRLTTTEIISITIIFSYPLSWANPSEMRAAVPVLLLVALAGCQSGKRAHQHAHLHSFHFLKKNRK